MKNVRFDTSKFYNTHLRQPRGNGGWFFECNNRTYSTGRGASFVDAKKAAAKYFQDLFPDQFILIIVLP